MTQLIYIILCQRTPISQLHTKQSPSRGYKTILGAYAELVTANAAVESHFNRFVMEHYQTIEKCEVLCGGIDKLSSATVTTEAAEYAWSIHEEVLRGGLGVGAI